MCEVKCEEMIRVGDSDCVQLRERVSVRLMCMRLGVKCGI